MRISRQLFLGAALAIGVTSIGGAAASAQSPSPSPGPASPAATAPRASAAPSPAAIPGGEGQRPPGLLTQTGTPNKRRAQRPSTPAQTYRHAVQIYVQYLRSQQIMGDRYASLVESSRRDLEKVKKDQKLVLAGAGADAVRAYAGAESTPENVRAAAAVNETAPVLTVWKELPEAAIPFYLPLPGDAQNKLRGEALDLPQGLEVGLMAGQIVLYDRPGNLVVDVAPLR